MSDQRKKKPRTDFTYADNKYVKSNNIKFNKEYLRKVRINRAIKIIVFLTVIILSSFMMYKLLQDKTVINDEIYRIDNTTELNINDDISFSENVEWYDNILFTFKQKEAIKGQIIVLPQGFFANSDGTTQILKTKEYGVKCLDGPCEKNQVYIINKKQIYGKIIKGE